MMILQSFVEIIIGFSGGIAVGAGFVAFLSVIGLIPRLFQMLRSRTKITTYTNWFIVAALFGSVLSFYPFTFRLPLFLSAIWGIGHGMFIGMLVAALTETLHVFPLILKRLHLAHHLNGIIWAIVFGKICGALIHWLVLVNI